MRVIHRFIKARLQKTKGRAHRTYQLKKAACISIIKRKGVCVGINCKYCPIGNNRCIALYGNRRISKPHPLLYEDAIELFLKTYGTREELVEALV